MAKLTILLAALCVFEFVSVSWSKDSDLESRYPAAVTKWQWELKDILAIDDPKERSKRLAALGVAASEACAKTAKESLNETSSRTANAKKLIDAITKRNYNEYVIRRYQDSMEEVSPDDTCSENAAEFMDMWMEDLNYTCNQDNYYVDLANDEECKMFSRFTSPRHNIVY